jgi:hypothetical protein
VPRARRPRRGSDEVEHPVRARGFALSEVGIDARKAAGWSALAGLAHIATVAFGQLYYPYLYDALIAFAYLFILPAIAVLHVRHALVRQSGAVLGTVAGGAAVVVGLGGAVNVDLRPAALVALGIWWWTIGKLWAETGVIPRSFGLLTAGLGAVAFASAVLEAGRLGMEIKLAAPEIAVWPVAGAALGLWLFALAATLMRPITDVPSR